MKVLHTVKLSGCGIGPSGATALSAMLKKVLPLTFFKIVFFCFSFFFSFSPLKLLPLLFYSCYQ